MGTENCDERLEMIQQQVVQMTKLDFSVRGKVTGKGDEFDAVVASLNILAEELQNRQHYLRDNEARMELIMERLLKFTVFDFSKKIPLSEKGDEIDAIAAGVNTLVDELEFRTASLRESEERFRLIVESIRDYAIFMLDPQGFVVSWNKGAQRIKGYSKDEIIGKHMSVFYTQEEMANNEPAYNLEQAIEHGRHEVQGWRVRKDGSRFWGDIIITPLYNPDGELKGFAKVTRDITEQKKTETEIAYKTEELARSNAELEQFAYVASHDLQEPLRMVNSYVQLLANRYKDKLDQDANDFIQFAVDGSNRMRSLINSLLEYSRVNRQKPFEPLDTNEIVTEVLGDLSQQIKDNEVIIECEKLPPICGDRVLIGQLFQNLISNAIKFRSERPPVLTITGKKKDGTCYFSVKDNGIGIKKDYYEKIFVIFQRLHGKHQYPGTGIGLAICKKIVEKHGGKITVDSEPGKGSTFHFSLRATC